MKDLLLVFNPGARGNFLHSFLTDIISDSSFEFETAPYMKAYIHVSPHLSIENNNLAGLVYGKSEGLEAYLKSNQKGFLQGNFEPRLLEKPFDEFKQGFDKFIDRFSKLSIEERSGWICSLNHGVLPKSSEFNVKYFIDSVRESFSAPK